MHNETSLGREDGEAMPSAASTLKIFIRPTSLDKLGQKTMKSVPTPTPRPATNSGPRSSPVDAENGGRPSAKAAPVSQPEETRSTSSLAIAPTKTEEKAETKQAASQRPGSNGKSSFLATRKVEPFKFPISKPKRSRAWADK